MGDGRLSSLSALSCALPPCIHSTLFTPPPPFVLATPLSKLQ